MGDQLAMSKKILLFLVAFCMLACTSQTKVKPDSTMPDSYSRNLCIPGGIPAPHSDGTFPDLQARYAPHGEEPRPRGHALDGSGNATAHFL